MSILASSVKGVFYEYRVYKEVDKLTIELIDNAAIKIE
jgi:hypothetical protein